MKSIIVSIFLAIFFMGCGSIPDELGLREPLPLTEKASKSAVTENGDTNGDAVVLDRERLTGDNTAYIQSVLDSDARYVVIPEGVWETGPLYVNRDYLTIKFDEGARLMALEGDFEGRGDCLLRIEGRRGITLLGSGGDEGLYMRKKDYQNEPYRAGEWRHTLSLLSSRDVHVEGLTLSSSGGDGIYIGQSKGDEAEPYCKDIVIKSCRILDHHRQGISVITAENLLIEDTLCWGTKGTLPRAGIDFEPNRPTERLVNCRVVNCRFENNAGPGIYIYLKKFNETTIPVSITIEDCVSRCNFLGIGFSLTQLQNNPQGTVTLKNNDFGLNLLGRTPRGRSIEIIEKDL